MDMALGCDIRIMTDGAKLAAAFTSRGVVPESGGTWILPRLIGWSKASEIIFTGKTLTAQESEEMGLVSKVVNNNEIYEEAAIMASKTPVVGTLHVSASLIEPHRESADNPLLKLLVHRPANDHGCRHLIGQLYPTTGRNHGGFV